MAELHFEICRFGELKIIYNYPTQYCLLLIIIYKLSLVCNGKTCMFVCVKHKQKSYVVESENQFAQIQHKKQLTKR